MSTHALRFRDHEEFHRAALQMAGAGGATGLVAYIATGGVTSPLATALIAVGAALAALAPGSRRLREFATRGVLVAMAAAALALGPRYGEPAAGLALFGGFFAAALSGGMAGRARWIAVAGGALIAVAAHHAMSSIAGASELAALPAWMTAALAGTAFALVSVIALVPRHLDLVVDTVGARHQLIAGTVEGEVRELVDRGHALWQQAATSLPEGDDHRQTLQEGVIRLFEVAERWKQADAEGSQALASSLVERLEDLDRRIDSTSDEVAREQYKSARAGLAEQLKYLEGIATNRERVLARMHNYLAAMERLRLALINRDSANVTRDAAVAPLIDDVEALGRDIDLSCAAMAEIEPENRIA